MTDTTALATANWSGAVFCVVEACERQPVSRGLCNMHYYRQRRYGDPLVTRHAFRVSGTCRAEGCDRPAQVKDLCRSHYRKLRIYGDPLATAPPQPKRKTKTYRRVSAPDHPLAMSDGTVPEHRCVLYDKIGPASHPCHWCGIPLEWQKGLVPRSLIVDHLDHDIFNNAPENLVPSCSGCNGHRIVGEEWQPWVPGTPVGQRSRLHTRCPKGHLMSEENVYIRPDNGQRRCVTCFRANAKEKYATRTLERQAADTARNKQRVPCPVCGEFRNRSGIKRHIRNHERAAA